MCGIPVSHVRFSRSVIGNFQIRKIYAEVELGRYTAEKSKRRYFCHTGIDIEQKILYRQTEIL